MSTHTTIIKTNSSYTSSLSIIGRIAEAIQWLVSRIFSIFKRKAADGAFDIEAQGAKAPSLWNRAYIFASDHKVTIYVTVTVGIVALCALAYYANAPTHVPSLPEKITPVFPSNTYTPPPTVPPAMTPIPNVTPPPTVPPAMTPIPNVTPFPASEPREKLPYSDWLQEKTTVQSGNLNSSITLFTSYTRDNPERLGLSQQVAANHKLYCAEQNYHHLVFERNLADGALPYWSKIAGLKGMVNAPENAGKKWFAWLDDDMVITNRKLKLESLIDRLSDNDHIIVTEDAVSQMYPNIPLNTGFILVRNSDQSRGILSSLWNNRFNAVGNGNTYADCPAQSCLHEQQALGDLLEEKPELKRFVRIIPQRFWDGIGINTFSRETHYDTNRQIILDYNNDPYYSKWREGDFMAQCTGMATHGYALDPNTAYYDRWQARNLRKLCIENLINPSKTPLEKISSPSIPETLPTTPAAEPRDEWDAGNLGKLCIENLINPSKTLLEKISSLLSSFFQGT